MRTMRKGRKGTLNNISNIVKDIVPTYIVTNIVTNISKYLLFNTSKSSIA